MTAYLSKIATRFNGSGVNSPAKNSTDTQTLMPSRMTFSNDNSTDFNFPPIPFSNEITFLGSTYSSDNESLDNEGKLLRPSPNYIESPPSETIRKLFYLGNTLEEINQEPLVQSQDIAPHKTTSSKSKPEGQYHDKDHILKPNNEIKIEKKINQNFQEISSDNSSDNLKDLDSYPSTDFEKRQSKDKTIPKVVPTRTIQKEQFSLENKTVSENNFPEEKMKNFPFDTVGQKEIMKVQPLVKQLRPATIKQRSSYSPSQKKRIENKIQIGSIRVEIIPAKAPKVKTRTQKLPQHKVALPSKILVSQNRFPLRFGLKQM